MAPLYRRYGCCKGLNRAALGSHPRIGYANWNLPATSSSNFYSNAYLSANHAIYISELSYQRHRAYAGYDPTGHFNGTWTKSFARLTQVESGSIPADVVYTGDETSAFPAWTLNSTTISGAGKIRTRVYDDGAAILLTEVDTLSSDYTDSQMATDLTALLTSLNWATVPSNTFVSLGYEYGTGNIVRADSTISPSDVLTADRSFLDLGFSPELFQSKVDVANIWSIQENNYVNTGVNSGWEDSGSIGGVVSCTNYASTNCRLHEITLNTYALADLAANTYILKRVIHKNALCPP